MNSIQTRLYNDFIAPQSSEISFNVCVSFFFFFFFFGFLWRKNSQRLQATRCHDVALFLEDQG